MYSAVQINVVKGCVRAVSVDATFNHVYLDSRGVESTLFFGAAGYIIILTRGQWPYRPAATRAMEMGQQLILKDTLNLQNHVHIASKCQSGGL